MVELKPCPFCGGEAKIERLEHDRDVYDDQTLGYVDTVTVIEYMAMCPDCECMAKPSVSMERAAELWNRRAERTCLLELKEDEEAISKRMGNPDAFFPQDIPTARFCTACGAKYPAWVEVPKCLKFCNNCGAKVVDE